MESHESIHRTPFRVPFLLVSAMFALSLPLSAWLLGRSWVRGRTGDEMIRVVGSARRSIRSDFIIWRGRVKHTAPTVAQAYTALRKDADTVSAYLKRKGIQAGELEPSAVSLRTLYAKTPGEQPYISDEDASTGVYRPIVGYELSQSVEVRSSRVSLVDGISRQSTELISQGIRFESDAPMYLYTKMSDLKVTMQAEAAQDARARAESIAHSSGCALGEVRFARMTAPSITPLYSNAESDNGVDDTTSLEKKITAIVTTGYAIK